MIGPEDYIGDTYQVIFETGKTSQFTIPINDDDVCEREEMFVANLQIPTESARFGLWPAYRVTLQCPLKMMIVSLCYTQYTGCAPSNCIYAFTLFILTIA